MLSAARQAYQRASAVMSQLGTHSSPSTLLPAGSLPAPFEALSSAPLDTPEATTQRDNARQLLPWTRRVLDEATGQVLRHVGEPTQRFEASGKPTPALFTPYHLGPLTLKNRIVVSPMCTYSADDGFLNDWHLAHLGQYAIGGASLIIVEATHVAPHARISPCDSGLWKDEQIAPLKRITALLASQNCRAGIQLAHAGRKASTFPPFQVPRAPATQPAGVPESLGGWPSAVVGASAVSFSPDYHHPHELSLDDINEVKAQFAAAVKRSVEAGFEYIEIHAAHGYLLSSFLSSTSNKRTDAYGGSLENRARLLLEVTREARALLPACALGVRLSCVEWLPENDPDAWRLDDTLQLVHLLQPLGVDLIDCSSGGNNAGQQITVGAGYQVPFAEAVKRAHPSLGVGAVGMLAEPHHCNTIVQQGQADLILLARELLRDPHWPLRAARELDFDMEWAPQYQRAKPSSKKA